MNKGLMAKEDWSKLGYSDLVKGEILVALKQNFKLVDISDKITGPVLNSRQREAEWAVLPQGGTEWRGTLTKGSSGVVWTRMG